MTLAPKPNLEPGDALLYRPSSPTGWVIAVKTWTRVAHVEGYAGDGMSIAARSSGVNLYALRTKKLAAVMRPVHPFNIEAAMRWFQTVRGQRYDWRGLLCFTLAVRQGAKDRMFCSELLTRWYRAGDFHPFNKAEDADHIAPSAFWLTPAMFQVWSDGGRM